MTSRYQGNTLIAEVEIEGLKKKFESTPGGLRLTTMCGWIYGDCNCNAPDKDAYYLCEITTAGNLTDATKNQIGVTSLPEEIVPAGGISDLPWRLNRGWIAKVLDVGSSEDDSGLPDRPIAISGRKFQISSASFVSGGLVAIKTFNPSGKDADDEDWFKHGDIVALYGGCDKTMTNCHKGHENMGRFGGFGMFIPVHNPITESTV